MFLLTLSYSYWVLMVIWRRYNWKVCNIDRIEAPSLQTDLLLVASVFYHQQTLCYQSFTNGPPCSLIFFLFRAYSLGKLPRFSCCCAYINISQVFFFRKNKDKNTRYHYFLFIESLHSPLSRFKNIWWTCWFICITVSICYVIYSA